MDIAITFKDFKTEDHFLKLQNQFARYDVRNIPNEDNYQKVVKTDFKIIYKSVNSLTYNEEYIEFSFLNDFLFPKINKLAKRYINAFKKNLKDNLVIEKEKIKVLAEVQLKEFFILKENVSIAEYLNKNVKIILQEQFSIVIEYLSNVHILPNYLFEEKLKFNINKADILVLFTLLREFGTINSPFDSELGLFIEKNFLYKEGVNYKPILKAGKVINDYKNLNRSNEKSIQRLKDIFQNDNFYEINI